MQSTSTDPTAYPEVNRVLLDLHGRVSSLLGDSLIGMYLYGSLASGGFEPGRSDIDFVVVTTDQLAEPLLAALESMHRELAQSDDPWTKKLEGAYVPQALIRRHDPAHPPVPTINEGKFYLGQLGSDWIFQRDTLRKWECILSGPSLREWIDPVSSEDMRAAILDIIDGWWEPMLAEPSRLRDPGYQPFAVLSMCRMLHTVATGEQASKSAAADWALDALPAEWSPLISHALAWSYGDEIESIDRTTDLMHYAIGLCRGRDPGAIAPV